MGKSVWTKIFGAIAGLSQISPDFGHLGGAPINKVIGAVALLLLGLVTKQANVTGGSVQQAPDVNTLGK
jgi:hypothetical protein